jgi:hypothetical protein
MNPKTQTLVSALRVLSVEIQSEDGVANAVVAEAADRLTLMANLVARHIEETKKDTQEMKTACETMNGATETIQRLKDRIKQLEEALERLFNLPNDCCCQLSNSSLDAWNNAHEALKAMEAKP